MKNQTEFTRRVSLVVLLIVGELLSGCTRGTPAWFQPALRQVKPEHVRFSYVVVADLRAADQLGSGWYGIEDGSFRWMARQATVYFKRPQRAQNVLELKLYLPEILIRQVGSPTLTVKLDGRILATEHLAHAGEYQLEEPIPTGSNGGEMARVDLELDRAMAPTHSDQRELGLVVTALGFHTVAGNPPGKVVR